MPDKIIVCADCRSEFTHSVGAQEFYAEKGFTEEPKRCAPCRKERKDKKRQVPAERPATDREIHSATCDGCGKEARVPFKPTHGKPIYCSKCYEGKK